MSTVLVDVCSHCGGPIYLARVMIHNVGSRDQWVHSDSQSRMCRDRVGRATSESPWEEDAIQ